MRAKRLAVVALALPLKLGRALVIRLGRLPATVVVGGPAPLSRAAAEGLAAELGVWPADGAGRRAVAVELAVALSLALAAVHFFWSCCGTRRWRERWPKATFCCFLVFYWWDLRRTRRPQRWKLVINLGQDALLRLPSSSVACRTRR